MHTRRVVRLRAPRVVSHCLRRCNSIVRPRRRGCQFGLTFGNTTAYGSSVWTDHTSHGWPATSCLLTFSRFSEQHAFMFLGGAAVPWHSGQLTRQQYPNAAAAAAWQLGGSAAAAAPGAGSGAAEEGPPLAATGPEVAPSASAAAAILWRASAAKVNGALTGFADLAGSFMAQTAAMMAAEYGHSVSNDSRNWSQASLAWLHGCYPSHVCMWAHCFSRVAVPAPLRSGLSNGRGLGDCVKSPPHYLG